MKNLNILLPLLFCITAAFNTAFSSTPFSKGPQTGTAAVESAHGLFSNPAHLGVLNTPGWLIQGNAGESEDVRAFRAGIHGEELGFAYDWFNFEGQDYNRYVMSWGSQIMSRTFLGMNLEYEDNQINEDSKWTADLGYIVRPVPFVSLGYFSENLIQSVKQNGSVLESRIPVYHHLGAAFKLYALDGIELGYEAVLTNREEEISLEKDFLHASVQWNRLKTGVRFNRENDNFFADPELFASINFTPHVTLEMATDSMLAGPFSYGASGFGRYLPDNILPGRGVMLHLNTAITNAPEESSFFSSASGVSLGMVRRQFEIINQDNDIQMVCLNLTNYRATLAISHEIRRLVNELKSQGKMVIAYLENVNNANYFVASAAEKIVIQPSAMFNLRGFAIQVPMWYELLQKIGVEPQFIRHGKFKSAIEPYTNTTMSDEFRANTTNLLMSSWNVVRDSIAASRNISPDSLDAFINKGSISLGDAKDAGLIDDMIYMDEIAEWAANGKGKWIFNAWKWQEQPAYSERWHPTSQVAVIYAEGTVVSGEGAGGFFGGDKFIGDVSMARIFHKIRKDGNVRAVVIRVDSPGGSALASDNLGHLVEELKKDGITVVVSVGSMAASGGYYLAAPADLIYAEANSVVGSIGIYGGKFDGSQALKKIGVNIETVKTHQSADAQSLTRAFTAAESLSIQKHMDEFYTQFINKVGEHRNMSPAKVDSLGQGQVFTGAQAIENGLIDELGGLSDAIEAAARLSGIPSWHKISTIDIHQSSSFDLKDFAGVSLKASAPLSKLDRTVQMMRKMEQTNLWAVWLPGWTGWN